ncbi:MAG: CoA transferase [Xanthomonadales bacterium]|nr:CoA transferase [Xanthomonadales bacterium]
MNKQIMQGVRVLDLTNVLAGPFATLHLALLGAEVIKIERPGSGDLARKRGTLTELNEQLMGTSFLAQNSNKKSVTLNTKSPEGKDIFKRLVKDADVLVENFRPGVMDRLELGYDILKEINPGLIYCAISGFGQTGPDAKKPAYDQIIQGLSGEMAVNGDERLNPLRTGFPVCDTVGGLNGAFAIMAALYHRERTGEGQLIDIAMLDSIMPMMGWVAANLLIADRDPVPMGNDNFTAAPSGVFSTGDGLINIAANKQEQWESVCNVLGLPELKTDERFEKRDIRRQNRKQLTPLLEGKLAARGTDEWVELLNAKGVPSGAILSLRDALHQPQIKHRETLKEVPVDGIGNIPLFNLTAKFEKTPGDITSPPPRLSAHTAEVLAGIGITEDELAELQAKRIV